MHSLKPSPSVTVQQKKSMEPTMYIPLAVTLVLLTGGTIFFRHRKKREKYKLDEKEKAIRSQQSQNEKNRKPNE